MPRLAAPPPPTRVAPPVVHGDDSARYFFSGVGQTRDADALLAADVDAWRCGGMVSAHRLLESPGLIDHVDRLAAAGVPLALDSGAFSTSPRRVTLQPTTPCSRTSATGSSCASRST